MRASRILTLQNGNQTYSLARAPRPFNISASSIAPPPALHRLVALRFRCVGLRRPWQSQLLPSPTPQLRALRRMNHLLVPLTNSSRARYSFGMIPRIRLPPEPSPSISLSRTYPPHSAFRLVVLPSTRSCPPQSRNMTWRVRRSLGTVILERDG